MRALAALLLVVWLAPGALAGTPALSRTAAGAGRNAVRPAPGHAARVTAAKRQTVAQRRAALRKRIRALEAQAAALSARMAAATDPAARAALEVQIDACRAEILADRRIEARLRRRGS
jgi:hypothetical protein